MSLPFTASNTHAATALPVYQHPGTIVLVDDDINFLRSMRFQLGARVPCRIFNDAADALAWLRLQNLGASGLQDCFSPEVESTSAEPPPISVALHIEQLCRIPLRAQRFMTPTVLVADYSMPHIDGLRLCEAAADLPCKKILLTGVADERVAVDAFNRGLIDRYVRKGDADALDRLDAELACLQRLWFMEQSHTLRALLPLHDYGLLNDPAVARLVGELAGAHRFVEHYLHRDPPGFLMFDAQARACLLVIETEAGLQAHYEMACDSSAPLALRGALARREVVPNFSGGDGMYSSAFGRDWQQYTAPAQVCHGREDYYWALFELAPGFLREPVQAFSAFLRQQRAHEA